MTSGPEISASSAHTAAEKEEEVGGWRAGLEKWRGGGLDGEVGVESWNGEVEGGGLDGRVEGGGLGWESGGWRAGMEKWG